MAKGAKRNRLRKAQSGPAVAVQGIPWGMCLLIFAAAFLLYANTLGFGYALDDDIYTRRNQFVQQGLSALPSLFAQGSLAGFGIANDSNYRPLTLLNFALETGLFGLDPHANHFFNVLFFAVTCVLIYLLLRKLLRGFHPAAAVMAALLFAFHPVHTEVVANIKSRDEILGLLFGLISWHCILLHHESGQRGYLVASAAAFFAAALCKENSLMLGPAIPLVLYFCSNASPRKILQSSAPHLALMLVYLLIRKMALGSVTINGEIGAMNNSLMAATNEADRMATAFFMLGKYLVLLFFPHPLSWDYSYNQIPIRSFGSAAVLLSVLVYIGLGIYAVVRFPRKDVFAFCIIFYFLTMFLVSNLIVRIGSSFAERFLYLPSLAFCTALAALMFSPFRTEGGTVRPSQIRLACGLLAVCLALFGLRLVMRNRDWKDNYSLFAAGLKVSPNSARAHLSMGSEYRARGEGGLNPEERTSWFKMAVDEYQKAIAIYARDAETHYNLGVSYYGLGENQKAASAYEETLKLNPCYAMALNNSGVIAFREKDYEKALSFFNRIIKCNPDFDDAYANIGAVYELRGERERALAYYDEVIKRNHASAALYRNLAGIYAAMGDKPKASYYSSLAAGTAEAGQKKTRSVSSK
jgi:Tfp pilus assembly protein PilF